jgi:hypothetical protein
MPYKNEHSCRLSDPGLFDEDSFRRIERGKLGIIIGKREGKDTTEAQAYRYPVDDWTEAQARAHCEKEGGEFHPAAREGKAMSMEWEWQESTDLFTVKFVGSPRNPYGTHASKGYPGGRDGWKKAWRVYLANVRDQGPIQGTVRRVSMIAAGMKPKCDLPEMSAEELGPRPGGDKLEGKVYEKPSDYGLSKWKTPGDDDLKQEDIQLTCEDLRDIKKICLQEIAYRQKKREKEKKSILEYPIKLLHESPGEFVVGGYGHIWGGPGENSDLELNYFTPESDLMPGLVPVKLATFEHSILDVTPDGDPFDEPIGKAHESETYVDKVGKWITARLDKRKKYIDAVMTLIDKGALNWSSGSIPHLTKIAQDGWLARWPVVEYAQTITPAEPRMTDVQRIRAAYKAAGLEVLWDLLKAQQAEGPDGEGEGDEGRLALAQAKLNLLKLHTR